MWHVFRIDRKTGEPKAFKTKQDLIDLVGSNPIVIKLEGDNKQTEFTGSLYDAPEGDYAVRGPTFRRHEWEAIITVDRSVVPPFQTV